MQQADIHIQRLNSQQVSQDPMEGWAEAFDIDEYIDDYAELIEDGRISPEAGEKVTRNLRKQVSELQERGGINDPKRLHQNIAFAEVNIGDSSFWVAAASGKRASNETDEDNPLLPGPFRDERNFDHRSNGEMKPYAMWDSEAKIIEHLAHEFDLENVEGQVKLFTERPPCDSCSILLEKFGWGSEDANEEFEGVEMNVSYDEGLRVEEKQ
ncbi:hypothetical protein ELS19_13435 [Halogeometricum borinquense]|uniref:Deaminase n=2 Tax=Halogeometricum borinquense TaxID=60847 RepID=A0A482TET1_9EURY|nr:hypothetical protein ELS19_13435 [Halogeometricum borinquense]